MSELFFGSSARRARACGATGADSQANRALEQKLYTQAFQRVLKIP